MIKLLWWPAKIMAYPFMPNRVDVVCTWLQIAVVLAFFFWVVL